jgi:hypothetical protein
MKIQIPPHTAHVLKNINFKIFVQQQLDKDNLLPSKTAPLVIVTIHLKLLAYFSK